MPQIRPITDLRNTNEISELCHARKELVFITKNGYGDLVVLSIEAYEELVETAYTDSAIGRRPGSDRRGHRHDPCRERLQP